MAIEVGEGLLTEAFSKLRSCGDGRRECVVYLTGPLGQAGIVDTILHPDHSARGNHYEIEPGWLDRTWVSLARERREIRVQVHTHGGRAFHSTTDDGYPIVQTAGFLSLVVPHFAQGTVGLSDAFLAELQLDGTWRELDADKGLVVV
jgi:hypothetical protein